MSRPVSADRNNRLILTGSLVSWVACIFLANDRLQGLLINSLLLAGGTLAISLPIGILLSFAIAKTSIAGRRGIERLMLAMLFVPLYVQAAAWQATAGQGGWFTESSWVSGWLGAIWVHGIAAVPWAVLFVTSSLRRVPRELEEESLQDAPAWQVLIRVSLRRAAAGLIGASLWISVLCFSEITVTDLFQVRTFAEEIYTAASLGTLDATIVGSTVTDQVDAPWFVAQEIWLGTFSIMLLVAAALAAISIWSPITDFVSSSSNWIWRIGQGRLPLSLFAWTLTFVVIGIPLIGMLGKAGEQITPVDSGVLHTWSGTKAASLIASSPWQHRREFGWSLAIGTLATLAATSIAIVIAWAIRTRCLPVWPTALLLAMVFAVPGPLIGVWTIRFLNQPSDSLLWPLTWCYDHTILAPVLVQFIRALPLSTLILGAQFASLPQDVLDSAESEGAGWWRRLSNIALPWCWPAVAAAACMAMIVSVGDLAATLLVVPPGVSPLSVRIFGLLHYGAEDRVSAVCLVLALLLGLAATGAWKLPRWINRES